MARLSPEQWEKVRLEYETSQFSDAELGRRHKVTRQAINKKAKKQGWSRDLATKVRELAKSKLVKEDAKVTGEVDKVDTKGCVDTDTEIELAAETRVKVVREHRRDISRLRDVEAKLLSELEDNPKKLYIAQYQGGIVKEEVNIAVTDRCAALSNLANVQNKRIALERTAFNLNDERDEGGDTGAVEVTFVGD